MQEPTYDIWLGTPPKGVKCLETVPGLENARERMKNLAAQTPGQYFIFSSWNNCVLDELDTQEDCNAEIHKRAVGVR